jgi:hypothetical protein
MLKLQTQAHWLARWVGTATVTPILLLVLVAFTLQGVGQTAQRGTSSSLLVTLLSLIAVAAGCAALSWVRPQRAGLSPPHVMLSLGFGGMLLGLAYDLMNAGPAQLESLCTQSAGMDLAQSFQLHLTYLPGMHIGMLIGGLLAIPSLRALRANCGVYLCSMFAQNLMCSAWMLLGMNLGAVWLVRLQAENGVSSLPGMLGGMFVGMTWGMVISVALYRSFFALRNRT